MRNYAQSHEVYHWPEFKAFAKRLGLEWDKGTKDLIIVMKDSALVQIFQSYFAESESVPDVNMDAGLSLLALRQEEKVDQPNYIDTTTFRNEKYRTKIPKPERE